MRIALHTCCGPCLLEPIDAYLAEGHEIAVVYANPNIHPAEEYERRLSTLREYARPRDIEVHELPYRPDLWLQQVGPLAADPAARCRACFALRLGLTAEWAREHGCEALATTLAVSPYQDADALAEEGRRAAVDKGLEWLGRDFRERYPEASRRSRELGMYRQNYCGCLMSDVEACAHRARARVERQARRDAAPTVDGSDSGKGDSVRR